MTNHRTKLKTLLRELFQFDAADLDFGIYRIMKKRRPEIDDFIEKGLLDAGASLAFGSDCPVEDFSPLAGIHAAVTRRRADGFPGPQGWRPSERITVAEAVRAYTQGAAYASGEERLKGSISPGKLADLVVLSQDIFIANPMDILETEGMATIFDGQFVYRRADFP